MPEKAKGITIEIGGNTTGLDKALKEVKSQANAVEKELRSVDRLLKLDPTNMELLSQKQELLGQATENLKSRYEALAESKKAVDADMATGTNINQEQYRQLSREIIISQTRIKELGEQQSVVADAIAQGGTMAGEAYESLDVIVQRALSRLDEGAKGGFFDSQVFEPAIQGASQLATSVDDLYESMEKTSRTAMRDFGKQAQSVQKELAQVNKLLKLDPSNVVLVSQKQALLAQGVATLKSRYSELAATKKAADEDMAQGTETNQEQYRELEREIIIVGQNLRELESQQKNVSDAMSDSGQVVNKSFASQSESADVYRDKVDQVSQSSIGLGDVAKRVFNAFGIDADAAIDGAVNALDSYNNKLDGSGTHTGAVAGAMAGAFTGALIPAILTVIDKVGELASKIVDAAMEAEDAGARMQVALGMTAEEAEGAQASIDRLNATGLFEGDEAEKALYYAMKYYGATGSEAEDLAIRLQAAFGKISGLVNANAKDAAAASATLRANLENDGVTAVESLNLISDALGSPAFRQSADQLLDAIEEFAPTFKNGGYSAQEMFSYFASGSAAGAKDLSKLGDALNDFQSDAARGTSDWKDGMQELGFGVDSAMSTMAKGGQGAQALFSRVIEKLMGMSNKADQARLSAALLGTAYDDTSLEILYAATQMGVQMQSAVDATGRATGVMSDTTSTHVNAVWKNVLTSGARAFSNVENLLDGNLKKFGLGLIHNYTVWGKDYASTLNNVGQEAGAQLSAGQVEGIESSAHQVDSAQQSAAKQRYDATQSEYNHLREAFLRGEQGITKDMVWEAEARLREAEKSCRDLGAQIPQALGEEVEKNKRSFLDRIGDLVKAAQDSLKNLLGSINSKLSNGSSKKGYASGTSYADRGIYEVGENGVELVQDRKGRSAMVGLSGPQFYPFSGGERVLTASQTHRFMDSLSGANIVDPRKIIASPRPSFTASSPAPSPIIHNYHIDEISIPAKDIQSMQDVIRIMQNQLQSRRKGYTGE